MLKFSNIFFIKHHFFISVQNFELFIISILLVLVMMLKHDLLVHSILTLVVTAIVLGESNFFLLFSFPSLLERQLNLRNIFSKFNYQEVNLLFWIFSLFFLQFLFSDTTWWVLLIPNILIFFVVAENKKFYQAPKRVSVIHI